MKRIFLGIGAAFFALCAAAQEPEGDALADPTRPSSGMADFLRERALEAPSMKICALVSGGDGSSGVALVGETARNADIVRRDSRLMRNVDGVGIVLRVGDVDKNGVEILSETPGAPAVVLRGSLTALAKTENPPPEFLAYLEANQVPLETLLKLVADQTGVNISASAETAQTPVSIFLRNVSASAAVEEICRATGLWYRRESGSNVIRVTTMREYEQNLTSFREEKTETFKLLYPNVAEVAGAIFGLYPDRTLLNLGEDELLEEEENDLSRRFRRFQMVNDNGGSTFLEMEAPDATSTGGNSASGVFSYTRGGMERLGSRDYFRRSRSLQGLTAAEAKRIDSALASSDTNAYENAFMRLAPNAANIFVTVSRKTNTLLVRTSDSRTMEDIRELIKRIDVPTPMVLLEVKVMELDLSDDFEASFQYAFANDQVSMGGTKALASGGFPGFDALNANTPLANAMSFQVITRAVDARIQLLAEKGKIKTLATPVLLTANNEVSRIFDGSQIPIIRGISSQTVVSENSTISSPSTEFEYRDVGTMLLITPNINDDGTVTLRVVQENSRRVEDGAKIPIYSSTSSTPVAEANVDVVHSRSLSGTFVAKDGMAVLAGGLIDETEKDVESRVPVLGSIPLVGWMFRSTVKEKSRTELVIMLRPHIIESPEHGRSVSDALLRELSAHPAADGSVSLDILRRDESPAPSADLEKLVR